MVRTVATLCRYVAAFAHESFPFANLVCTPRPLTAGTALVPRRRHMYVQTAWAPEVPGELLLARACPSGVSLAGAKNNGPGIMFA